MTLGDLFLEYGCIASERQDLATRRLAERPGYGFSWKYDATTRELTLGKASVRASPLATFNDEGVWTWAWADTKLPAATRATAERLRELGRARGVSALDVARGKLEVGAKALAYVAIGLLGDGAYHIGKPDSVFDETTLFLIEEEALSALAPPSAEGMSDAFFGVVGLYDLQDHRRVFRAYAEARGLAVRATERELRASLDGDREIVVRLDADGHALDISEEGATAPRAATGAELCSAMKPALEQLVQVGVDYVRTAIDEVDAVYAIGSMEQGATAYGMFFRMHGRMVRMGKLDPASAAKPDLSLDAQRAALKRGTTALLEFARRCSDAGLRVPTVVKVVLEPKTAGLTCEVEYELVVWTRNLLPDDLFEEWFAALGG